jgi:DNA repair protein RadA/Sms
VKTTGASYRCRDCGYVSLQWLGRCPECGEWNSFAEEIAVKAPTAGRRRTAEPAIPLPIKEISASDMPRFPSGSAELDRVLGGGIVPGSLVLLGGEPGIGKSTLLLQTARDVAAGGETVLIASGEESQRQIKMRADRLGSAGDTLYVMSETDIGSALETAAGLNPALLIVDSIQAMTEESGGAGSISQVRGCTARLMAYAKDSGVATFIIGHVTKEGAIAGPRVLEHIVDTVLYFEGDPRQCYRIVRAAKNRFGSTDEIGVFEMGDAGLREVANPSEVFLSDRREGAPGSVVTAAMEGTRPLLIELQALAAPTSLAYPRRVAAGIDFQRLTLLTAVLERRAGLKLGNQDIYVSAAGGLKVSEPAADLGVALAVASAFRDAPVPAKSIVFGEVSLSGEVRPVALSERRLKEAARLGFKTAIVPKGLDAPQPKGMAIIEVESVKQAIDLIKKGRA